MKTPQEFRAAHKGSAASHRLTIGLLGEELLFSIPIAFFRGVEEMAKQYDVNVLYIASNALHFPHDFRIQSNIFYDMIGPQNVDALLVASNLLGGYTAFEELLTLFERYASLPTVSLGLAIKGIPSVVIDNARGMYASVAHLIDVHTYRRIAFIGGPAEHPDAQERYQAYRQALDDYGVPFDADLVLPGDFQTSCAAQAVRLLLDERRQQPGRDVQAIVTANDYTALGVLAALQERGVRIPEDLAVVGFDDIGIVGCMTPPLTTVRAPFYEVGQQGMRLLMAKIAGEQVPEITPVPAQIVVRHSCGCLTADATGNTGQKALPEELALTPSTAPRRFLHTLNQELQRTTESDIMVWSDVLALLRRHMPSDGSAAPGLETPEALLRQVWDVVGTTMYRVLEDRNVQLNMDRVSQALLSTVDLDQLCTILASHLPRLGIRQCYLMVYVDPPPFEYPQSAPEWSQLLLAAASEGRIEIPTGGKRFPTRHLIPERMWPAGKRYTLILEALYFQREQIGFTLLEAGASDEPIYASLRRQISNTLYQCLLKQRLQENAYELVAAYEEINILNDQLKEENLRMSAELDVARRIQEMMLPKPEEFQHLTGWDIAGYMNSADEVGGDYYDILNQHGTLHIGIGDVTGHGLESGILMLMTQTAIRTLVEHGETDPVKFVTTLNRTIYKNAHRMRTGRTLTFALVTYQDGELKIVGQHEELLVIRHGGVIERVDTMDLGLPIGLEADIEQWVAMARVRLQPAEGIVLYTDGITEAENSDGKQYGLPRLCDVLSRCWDQSADAIKQAVVDDVLGYIGTHKQFDDLTIVVLKHQ